MSVITSGEQSVIPTLVIDGAADAIALYKKAFNAQELSRMESPDGSKKIMHACIQIGNSKLFISDTHPQMCASATNSNFYLYFKDVDAAYKQATNAGLTDNMPPQDMFWGDRMGNVKDKFGISWSMATHVRNVSPEEMAEAAKTFGNKAA